MTMAYDSDSSTGDDVETGVTLGYASEEPTGDDFSRLGGHPSWLDGVSSPSGSLARCKVCNDLLSLLLQLNGDVPDRLSGHERRLYIFGCRRRTCRRKNGSIRALRSTRIDTSIAAAVPVKSSSKTSTSAKAAAASPQPPITNIGDSLFGVKSGSTRSSTSNPFAPAGNTTTNPFATKAPETPSQQAQRAASTAEALTTATSSETTLSHSFAEKARIAADSNPSPSPKVQDPPEPWPDQAQFPKPHPSYYIDADKEFLEPEPPTASSAAQVLEVDVEGEAGGSSSGGAAVDAKDAFESSMDKTFQRFADRMSQNPGQVLRYEYDGQPLLYSRTDAIGKTWPRVPRCGQCGGERTFELQLTPHAITELEADDTSLDGMDWGTIILAVCVKDCEGWNEEWIGVQWEELDGKKPA